MLGMIYSDSWAHIGSVVRQTSIKVLCDWYRMVLRWSDEYEPSGPSLRTRNLMEDIDRLLYVIENDPFDYGWDHQWGEEIEMIGDTMNRMGITA